MSIRFRDKNYIAITLDGNLVPGEEQAGGDFLELDPSSDIQNTLDPTEHPYLELDSENNITIKNANTFLDTYRDLITPLYKTKPKFMSWLDANLDKLFSPNLFEEIVDVALNLDYASGVSLDVLGSLVGASRRLSFTPIDGSGANMNDENYRTVIRAKIIRNAWRGGVEQVQVFWNLLFPNTMISIRDNQNMTMDVVIFGGVPILFRELVQYGYIVPKPETVLLNSVNYADLLPAFGYDMETHWVNGYDIGKWAGPAPVPPFFGYDQNDSFIAGYGIGGWDLL